MGRSKETFGKKEVRNKQLKKRKEKEKRKLERKEQGKDSFDDMIAWVDENGQILDAPPDETQKTEVKAEDIPVSVPKGGFVREVQMNTGKIKNFDSAKGYGFISCNQFQDPVFVHIKDCDNEPEPGDKVEFETESGPKGLKAVNVLVKKEGQGEKPEES
ncbi:MAG: cold shock domain-containing protein [Bacteroidales bacterium]|nr:cold shock domain-containing protein [Bacteroidales bacterium]